MEEWVEISFFLVEVQWMEPCPPQGEKYYETSYCARNDQP